jgi:hypothetical protein
MDLVTLSTSRGSLSLDRKLVRLVIVEETEDDHLQMLAEEVISGTAAAAVYPPVASSQTPIYIHSALPEPINPPVILLAPPGLAHHPFEFWIGVSGGENWGGCELWISRDNATYRYKDTIKTPARQGILTAFLPWHWSDLDEINTLSVDLSMSRGTLENATEDDADNLRTLCQVGGRVIDPATKIIEFQFISFANAVLTGSYCYDLTYLVRKLQLGGRPAVNEGTPFLCLDDSVYKWGLPMGAASKTYYLKFLSINLTGTKKQSLDEVEPYVIVVPAVPPTEPAYQPGLECA